MSVIQENHLDQEVKMGAAIKCEDNIKTNNSDTFSEDTEMNMLDSKTQLLNTANAGSIEYLNIKPEPFEVESPLKQEFVEETEMSCPDATFLFEEVKVTNTEQTEFSASNANTDVNCDPLATENYIKQENEVYVTPSFSAFSNDNGDSEVAVKDRKATIRCDVCNSTFTERASLKNHMRIHTGEKPYKCDVCNKNFSRASYLNVHKHLHTGEKPYKCDTCDKTFNLPAALRRHKITHTDKNSYRCDVCDKCFTRLDSLKVHKRLHSVEKPYQCDVCTKSFSRLSHANMHKRIHTGEKPYQCDVCDKTFSRSQQLTTHKLTHTGERPYKCDVCAQTFIYSFNFHRHKLTQH